MVSLKDEVASFLGRFGVFKVGVADPKIGFKKALDGCHPKDVMEDCNSVIVFALHVGLDYYTILDYGQEDVEPRLLHIYRDWVCMQLANLLKSRGYNAVMVPKDYVNEELKVAPLSFKLAAYEAGIGVFGRPSIIITPEFGPRINIGVVLTNAALQPDKPLANFNPCEDCEICVELCPVKAIKKDLPPPTGFNRDRCLRFVQWLREKSSREIMFCGYCFNSCPVGRTVEKTFEIKQWKSLLNLDENEKEKLLRQFHF